MRSKLWSCASSARTRLANARKRVDDMVAGARVLADKVLAKRSDGTINAHADRLHRMVDEVNAQAKQASSDPLDLNITMGDRTFVDASDQSTINSRKAASVETAFGAIDTCTKAPVLNHDQGLSRLEPQSLRLDCQPTR